MDPLIFHIVKAFGLAVVMLISMRILGFSYGAAAACSLIPLALGLANVLSGFAYTMTGLVLIIAVSSMLVPAEFIQWLKSLPQIFKEYLTQLFEWLLQQT